MKSAIEIVIIGVFQGLVFPCESRAETSSSRDVERIKVSIQGRGVRATATFEKLDELFVSKSFALRHPDKTINPQMVRSEFSGIMLDATAILWPFPLKKRSRRKPLLPASKKDNA